MYTLSQASSSGVRGLQRRHDVFDPQVFTAGHTIFRRAAASWLQSRERRLGQSSGDVVTHGRTTIDFREVILEQTSLLRLGTNERRRVVPCAGWFRSWP